MFEQSYIAEFDQCAVSDVDTADGAKSKSLGAVLAMPLASLSDEQGVIAETVHAADAIFGNAWPGLALACC